MSSTTAGRAETGQTDLMAAARRVVDPSIRDPRLFYPSLGHQDALERLRYSTIPGSLIVVSGEAGIGKSLLMAVLLERLSSLVTPVVVDDPSQIRPDTRFLRSLIALADGEPHGRTGLELTAEFMERAAAIQSEGRMVSILIDDAHRLSGSQLEILRALLSSASPSQPVNVVLFGEPELIDKIGRKRRLADRVAVHHTLNPLNRDDALAMLDHRLRQAGIGSATTLFTSAALEALYTRSRGNPGAMFTFTRQALTAAIDANLDQIDTQLLQETFRERGVDRQIRLPFGEEALTGEAQPAGS